jgi:AAHS family 4-hydroxybenzoate transporter-like MFS transporter
MIANSPELPVVVPMTTTDPVSETPSTGQSLDAVLGAPRSARYQIVIIVVCALIAMIDGYDTQVIALAAPDIASSWSMNPASFGAVFGIGLFGGLIGALLFGFISDRYGRKPTLLIAVTAFGLVCLATPFAQNIEQLFAIRFLTGLGLGGALPSLISITAEYTPGKRRNTVVGIMFCGFPLGAVIAGVLATKLIPAHGWQSVFIVGGLAPLILVPVIWKLLPESARFLALKGRWTELQAVLRRIGCAEVDPSTLQAENGRPENGQAENGQPETGHATSSVARLFTDGRAVITLMLWLTFLLSLLLTYLLTNWIPIIARQAGSTTSGALLGVAALNLGAILGCLTIGGIADRWNPTRTISIAFALGAIAIALIGQATTSVATLLVTCLVAGFFSIGAQMCTVAWCAGFYETSLRATGVGWAVGIGRIGAIAGPVLGGILIGADVSATGIFLVTGVASIGAAIAVSVIGLVGTRRRGAVKITRAVSAISS